MEEVGGTSEKQKRYKGKIIIITIIKQNRKEKKSH